MNKVYRVIWNHSLRCMVAVSELASSRGKSNQISGAIPATSQSTKMLPLITAGGLLAISSASYASNPQVVDNTTTNFDGETVMTARAESAMIVKGAAANAIFNNGFISASAPTANAVQVEDGANFDVRNSTMQTFIAPTMTILSGSTGNILNSQLSTISGTSALFVGENSALTGNDVRITSSKNGMLVDNSRVDINGLNITTTGSGGGTTTAMTASNGSNINLDNATLTTNGVGGHGIYAVDSTVNASNIAITATNASARGVLATGADTQVTLDGGSINTNGANGHAIQASSGATVDVSNMDLNTTSLGLVGYTNGAAAIFANTGAIIKADSLNLSSAGNAVWVQDARFDGNNLKLTQTNDFNGPIIWAQGAMQLNLKNSLLTMGDGMVQSEGIYVDNGIANLADVTIVGNSGGTAITTRFDGTMLADDLDIAINNADNLFAAGIYMSRGTGKTNATLTNSNVVVNGSNAAAIRSNYTGLQTVNLINTLIQSDNVAAKSDAASSLQINADASTLNGKILIQGGTANSTNQVADFIKLNATNGSQLYGDADIDHLYTRDSLIALDNASAWQGASIGLHQLTVDNGSRWTMTADSDVGSLNMKDSEIVFDSKESGFSTLTVDGDFEAANGTLVMNSVLADDASSHDQLVVKGNTSGTAQVAVHKAGGSGAQTLQGIELITVGGESNGEFTQKGRIVAGAYDYQLQRGTGSNSKNWYLISGISPVTEPDPVGEEGDSGKPVITPLPAEKMTLRPEAGNYIANIAATNTLFNLRLHDRGGETSYVDALTGEKKLTSLWMRNLGGHQQVRDSSGQLKTQTNRYVLQLGGDVAQGSFTGSDSLHLGAMAGYGNARSNTDSSITGYRSQGHTTGYNVGVYGTWYQQPNLQTGAYVDSWLQYSWFNNSVNGDHLSAERYQSRGFTASLESGYSWKVGEDSFKNSYFIEPNAQFIWMGVKADDVTEANGTRVSSQGDGNVQSRLGLRASMKTPGDTVFKPYLEANWINNSKAFATTLDGVQVNAQGAKDIAELRIGLESQLSSNINVWGSLGQQAGNNQYRDSSAALGVKISF